MWSVQQDEDDETAEAELEASDHRDHARTDEPSSLKLKLQRAVKVRVGWCWQWWASHSA